MQIIWLLATSLDILFALMIISQILVENKLFKVSGSYDGKVSVIMPIRGIDPTLLENINSIEKQRPYELLLVADPDDTETINFLRKAGKRTLLSENVCETCSGKIRAQLTGLKYATGDCVIFVDSDSRVRENWINQMISPLDKHDAVSTFSWPVPVKYSVKNLLRAGYWTLGFESQGTSHNFLWGGSMAFRRNFFSEQIISEMSTEWCDDCALTRIVKRRQGKISFNLNAMPLNYYDERKLSSWAIREAKTIWKYYPKGARTFLLLFFILILLLTLSVLSYNILISIPLVLWIVKNLFRGRNVGKIAIIPAIMSIAGIFFGGYITLRAKFSDKVEWRGRVYELN
ncbi:glycosyl transferase family 2 [Sulfolobales archaeon HS-7]|nr:glycosyl transferase family 2 [Sulfolobales archaeon HS-7]